MFCQKVVINLKEGVDVEMRDCYFLIYLQFNHINSLCGKSKVSFITFQLFSLLSQTSKVLIQVFIVLKNCAIFIFLIYSGSVQKMLTALFKLVWNTQKTICTNVFEYQGKMFLSIEKVFGENKCRATLNAPTYCFLHIFEIQVSCYIKGFY